LPLAVLTLLLLAIAAPGHGSPPPFAETVTVTLPQNLALTDLGGGAAPAAHALRFGGARLRPGHVLRISLLAVGGEMDAARFRFRCRAERGGIGLTGTPSTAAWVAVFESDPGAQEGLASVEWTLEGEARDLGAGRHRLELRWKVESVPRGPGGGLEPPATVLPPMAPTPPHLPADVLGPGRVPPQPRLRDGRHVPASGRRPEPG
jgi:hypothetical protein